MAIRPVSVSITFVPLSARIDDAVCSSSDLIRSHLKKRILVRLWRIGFYPPEADKVRGGAEFKTAGILMYFEDFRPTFNVNDRWVIRLCVKMRHQQRNWAKRLF